MEAVREASAALDAMPPGSGFDPSLRDDPFTGDMAPTQEEIMRTVAAERRRLDIPRFAADQSPPAPRGRRRPRQRDLFDELVELLEGNS
ncbi:MAG: hypothetical protein HY217_00600 [Candidatus Rokubacteria bacterium]|nr:hypothetical protein [Candidatus Rokubacteria bacterium]